MTRQYFVVGARTDGANTDLSQTFISRGYWEMSQFVNPEGTNPRRAVDEKSIERYNAIQIGDRIAIKRMNGMGSAKITILAIGIVTDLDEKDYRVYVNWVKGNMQKKVESHGCFARIHGPYTINETPETRDWLNEVFRL